MRFREFKYFIDLYELKSFTKVAEKNFTSQSMISKSIKKMEEFFETKLVKRAKFSTIIGFTKDGELVYKLSKDVLKKLDKLEGKINKINENNKLIIGYVEGSGNDYIMEYINSLIDKEKNYIELVECTFMNLKEIIKNKEINFLLGYYLNTSIEDEEIKRIILKEVPFNICMSKEETIKDEKVSMQILNDKTIISLKRGSVHFDVIEEIIRNYKIKPRKIIYVHDMETLNKLIEAGIGWSILCIDKINESKKIKMIQIECSLKINICLEYYKYRNLTDYEREVIGELEEVIT
ncbi:LysR family transcriptional regulator [uncultured Clostridium sp.]|uniref:LysR family transcriptional regulator n=1 Tax=uncultured Clostridium sp. TaxID=59620 RepID=UPI00262B770A|nr:LysR family transcriptional regulator [uncultured Clostridium sp.]